MGTSQAEVTMVTVPVAMVTVRVAMEIYGLLHQGAKLRSRDVTHVTGLGDILWLVQKPYISILLSPTKRNLYINPISFFLYCYYNSNSYCFY